MSTLRTKPGRRAGFRAGELTRPGEVWTQGRVPRGTCPKRAGSKLSRRVARIGLGQHQVRGGGL